MFNFSRGGDKLINKSTIPFYFHVLFWHYTEHKENKPNNLCYLLNGLFRDLMQIINKIVFYIIL